MQSSLDFHEKQTQQNNNKNEKKIHKQTTAPNKLLSSWQIRFCAFFPHQTLKFQATGKCISGKQNNHIIKSEELFVSYHPWLAAGLCLQ